MKVYHSNEYDIIGYDDGDQSQYKGWVLRQKVFKANFDPETIIINECKFIDHDGAYYLLKNGRVEKNRMEVALPAYAEI